MRALKILVVSFESAPFFQRGGLGEVSLRLPQAISRLGQDVRVVLPWYRAIDVQRFGLKPAGGATLRWEGHSDRLRFAFSQHTGVPTWFIGHPVLGDRLRGLRPDRHGIYAHRTSWLYCAAVAGWIRGLDWKPDVVHLHDYFTGLVPWFLGDDGPRCILSIQTAGVQGHFLSRTRIPARLRDVATRALPRYAEPRAGAVNLLERGIEGSNRITIASRTYARELLRPDDAEGLAPVLRKRRKDLAPILNGLDRVWNPSGDTRLPEAYDARTLSRRARSKRALQRLLGLPELPGAPVLAMVARIDEQKGWTLLFAIAHRLFARGVQLALSGNGFPEAMRHFERLSREHSQHLGYLRFVPENEPLFFAGADLFLAPSRYEPCGLTQLKALKYGCVPVVRRTGGLADTVQNYNPRRRTGTGFVFNRFEPEALDRAISRALAVWRRPAEWRSLQRRGMREDFSWDGPAKAYLAVYRRAVKDDPRPVGDPARAAVLERVTRKVAR